MPHRIFIVEDHAEIRRSIRMLLEYEDGLEVCGEASSAEEALEQVEAAAPDLVLVDVSLPKMSGITLVSKLRGERPDLPVLMLSGHDEELYGEDARQAGANGYIMKHEGPEPMLARIHDALAAS